MFASDSGISTFHARFISWSKRNRGIVQRMQHDEHDHHDDLGEQHQQLHDPGAGVGRLGRGDPREVPAAEEQDDRQEAAS